MTMVYLGIGWFLGLLFASAFDAALFVSLGVSGLSLLGAYLFRGKENVSLLLLSLSAAGFGAARFSLNVPDINQSHVAFYNGSRDVTLTGLVVDEPDVRDKYVNLRVEAESISLPGEGTVSVAGDVLVRSSRFPVIPYGTRIELKGSLETPEEGEAFNYKEYLAREGIHSLIQFPELIVLGEGEGSPIREAIFRLKARAQTVIDGIISEPQASLLSGILLGNDNGLSEGLAEAFRVTGMTHIIAISGFNIMILIGVLNRLGEPILGRRAAVIFAMFGIGVYTILVGADASVVRAAIMGSVYLLARRLLGRPNYAYASLILAGLIMTLFDPLAMWGAGFQLSFAATLGLMLYADRFSDWTRQRLKRLVEEGLANRIMNLISDSVIVTMAAQVLTMPLIIAYFQQISFVSLLANALILPAQPGVMIWGGLATISGMVIPVVGQVVGYIAWLFLAYTTGLVRLLANIPGASVPIEVSTTGVILIYAIIGAITWLAYQEAGFRTQLLNRLRTNFSSRLAVGASLILAVLVIIWSLTQPDGRLHVAFLDVGQGDAIFIQTPSGRQLLVDGGHYPSVLNEQLGRQMPFWDRSLDIVVATHPDADHVSGLPGVFARYRVGQFITNGEGLGVSPLYDEVLNTAEEAGVESQVAVAKEVITIEDGVWIEILHPGPTLSSENRNDNSVSLRLVYGDFSLLLTGDAEEMGERTMLANSQVPDGRSLSALVFKAGHHGSRSSSNAFFLEAVRPQIVVISAGKDNRFGHPHPEVLARAAAVGATILRTDELGTIEVISDGESMWWQSERSRIQDQTP